MSSPWWRDSNQTASGKPGAVQPFVKLTRAAYENVCDRLRYFGNELSVAHQHGLMFQAGVFALKALGKLPGRHQITLAPGVGKTEGLVSFVKAVHDTGHSDVGVVIATSKVEEICTIKRKLIDVGVPPSRIGVWHEYSYDADKAADYLAGEIAALPPDHVSEPSERHGAQFLLITHERIKRSTDEGSKTYRMWKGKPRMVAYDEALIKSKATAIPVAELRVALVMLSQRYGNAIATEAGRSAFTYLSDCEAAATVALGEAMSTGTATVIKLPKITAEEVRRFKNALPRKPQVSCLRDLLDVVAFDLKAVPTGKNKIDGNTLGGLVTYEITIPEALTNVAILDASYPVRNLVQLDQGITRAENDPKVRKALGQFIRVDELRLSEIKRYDRVNIKQLRIAGGRTAMEADFQVAIPSDKDVKQEDGRVCLELADVVGEIPKDEAVLIFTFKDRDVKFKSRIEQELAKVTDITATIPVPIGDRTEHRKRINILTWGQETAVSDYAHCAHVILAGVIRRNRLELEGAVLGQSNATLTASLRSNAVSEADLGEVLHSIYQALNRGRCRTMQLGQAGAMTAWIMHRNKNIQTPLATVMPGVVWDKWVPRHFEMFEGSIEEIADWIDTAVRNTAMLPKRNIPIGDVAGFKIPSRALKVQAEAALERNIPARTWAAARKIADLLLSNFAVFEGQSYHSITPEHFGLLSSS